MVYLDSKFKGVLRMEGLNRILKANRGSRGRLAKFLGVDPTTVWRWATGSREPNFKMLITISDYFAVSIDELIRVV